MPPASRNKEFPGKFGSSPAVRTDIKPFCRMPTSPFHIACWIFRREIHGMYHLVDACSLKFTLIEELASSLEEIRADFWKSLVTDFV